MNSLSFSRPGLHKQIGAFPILEIIMKTATRKQSRGFSLVELVIVVSITGIIAAIAVPRFADADSGRRLQAAKNILIQDIESAKLRARATSTQHTFKLYKDREIYVIAEGNEISTDSIILARNLTEDPYKVNIKRSNLTGDEVIVITPQGDLSPGAKIQLEYAGTAIVVTLPGIPDSGLVPVVAATDAEVEDLGVVDNILDALGL